MIKESIRFYKQIMQNKWLRIILKLPYDFAISVRKIPLNSIYQKKKTWKLTIHLQISCISLIIRLLKML